MWRPAPSSRRGESALSDLGPFAHTRGTCTIQLTDRYAALTSSASTARMRSSPHRRSARRARRRFPICMSLREYAVDCHIDRSRDSDDVMQMTLNPHDSYKTSILSGLSPTIILDIASRALNFYTYQVRRALLLLGNRSPGESRAGPAGGGLPSAHHEECARSAWFSPAHIPLASVNTSRPRSSGLPFSKHNATPSCAKQRPRLAVRQTALAAGDRI